MNADLLAMLGGAGSGGSGSGSASRRDEGKSVLTFKAGKMTTTLQPNGKYMVTPDPRRGEINLTWTAAPSTTTGTASSSSTNAGTLKFEWKDRRTKAVVDTSTIFADDRCTYSKIDTGRDGDRVYLLQYGNASDRRFFFWMQDKDVESDEKNREKVQKFLTDPTEAGRVASGEEGGGAATTAPTPAAASGTAGAPAAASGTTTASAAPAPSSAAAPAAAGQVDALSSILENLGMPPASSTTSAPSPGGGATPATPASGTTSAATPDAPARPSASAPAPAPAPAATTGGGTLTLADLQGAMAGLATASPTAASSAAAIAPPGPPLSELATPDAVSESGILDNEATKAKLIALLPEGQRDEEHLLENLRSPQVSQALRSLTQALMPDPDTGSTEGFHSIVANFRLEAQDGTESLQKGNPIQAFLDCVLKSVEREKKEKGEKEKGSGDDDGNKDDEGESKKDEEGGGSGAANEEKMAE